MNVAGGDNGTRLEKIQGGVDLINERLRSANELQTERHAWVSGEINHLKKTDEQLDGRVGKLEARDNILVGERQGIGLAAKVLPFLCGGGVIAVAAFIGRAIGL